jgi:2-amino-4-hydroxy-6-hydroxymethyldihydropteridine diphosphokinase
MSVVRVYLSIGSNVEPTHNVRSAVAALRSDFGQLILSPVYRNPAVGFSGDDFLNLVVGLDTELTPLDLAERLRALEDAHGRLRQGPKFASRTLDIDILTYGDAVLRLGRLVIPRDEILRYAFVLRPLADVAGDEVHPETGQRYRALWRECEVAWGYPPMETVQLALADGGDD